jgi:multiple sugar transport system permease protein
VTTTVAPSSTAAAGTPSRRPRGAKLVKMLPLSPAIGLMLVFLAGPILYCVYAAFTNMALTGPGAANVKFVGLDNFRKAFSSGAFTNSIWLTLVFTLISAIIGQNTLGLGLALLMRKSTKVVRNFVGTAVIGAWVLPEIVAAYLLSAFFNDDGTLNVMLHAVGLPGQDWLYGAPIIAVSLANIWRGTAFSMLVYSAALSEIPKEIEESAEMDGAGGWRRLLFVTIPMITRAVMTNLMLITLQTLSVFTLIYVMTAGGPGFASSTLPVLMYQQAFKFSEVGYGTAISLLLLATGAVFSFVYVRVLKPEA